MADGGYDFDNPTFDPTADPDYDEDALAQLPDIPVLDPPADVQRNIEQAGDRLTDLTGQLREQELLAQRRRLVDAFYDEIARDYKGLRPSILEHPYDQFSVGDDGKTLYWKVGDRTIRVSSVQGAAKFLGLGTLARQYGSGGTYAIRTALGLEDYSSSQTRLRQKAVTALQNIPLPDPSEVETLPLKDLSQVANEAETAVKTLTTTFTDAEIDDLLGLDQQAVSGGEGHLSLREIHALDKALQRVRGELVNNLAKLSELDEDIARNKDKLKQVHDDPRMSDEIGKIEDRLKNLEDERSARLEAAGENRAALRSQINRIRETISRILNEDTTLADKLRTLFREQGITIASVLTALGFIISTLVLALTGGGSSTSPTPVKPPGKDGVKQWVKKHLQAFGRVLARLAGKAAAALPGIIGSIVSWLLNVLSKTASWLANNLWALAVALGGLLLIATKEWLAPGKLKE